MRDSQIHTMQAINARRSGMLLDRFVYLDTRQRALETVMFGLTLWSRIKLLFYPGDLKEIVDRVHIGLWNEEDKKRKDVVAKAKEEAAKPKLTIVGANGQVHG